MQKRTKTEWTEPAAEYYASGLAQRAWCESKGISLYTFRGRLSKMRKSAAKATAAKGETVAAAEEKCSGIRHTEAVKWLPVKEEATGPESEIRIGIGGFEILLKRGFDETAFGKICRVLVKIC